MVLGIIGLLLALLLPVLSAARHSARQVQCMANQRELLAACLGRAIDSDGFLPLAGTVSVPSGTIGYGSLPLALNDSLRKRYVYVKDEYPALLPTLEEPAPWPASLLPYLAADVIIDEGTLVGWKKVESSMRVLELYRCPSAQSPTSASYGSVSLKVGVTIYTPLWDSTIDYALNEGLLGFSHNRQHDRWRMRGHVGRAGNSAQVVVLSDADNQAQASQMFTWTPGIGVDRPVTLADAFKRSSAVEGGVRPAGERHRGRTTVAFADGHVEALSHEPAALRQAILSN